MACSSIVGQDPYQFLQSNAAQQSAGGTAATGAASTAQLQIQIQAQGQAAPHHRHHGGNRGSAASGVSDLLDTIEQALQSADSSEDPNKVIEDTVAKLLSGGASTSGTGSGAATNSGATDSATTSQSQAKQSFADVLKAHGVDFQQFRADLLAAVKDAQNGEVKPATALKSFAPGSTVDLTA